MKNTKLISLLLSALLACVVSNAMADDIQHDKDVAKIEAAKANHEKNVAKIEDKKEEHAKDLAKVDERKAEHEATKY